MSRLRALAPAHAPMPTPGALTCGDLFAGIGGMSLGLQRAGFTVRWQVECEPYCETILARHWPHVARRRDVRLAGAQNLEPVDLVAGGFPCQDISAAGKGVGLTGWRSGLWREFARIVSELHPRWVLVENVPALRRRGADTVLGDLEAAGYAAWPLVVGARHVGAPHRRDRVWIVAQLVHAGCSEWRSEPTLERAGRGQEGADWPHESGARVADPSGGAVRQQPRRGDGPSGAGAGEPCAHGLADGDATRLEGRGVPRCERADQWPVGPGGGAQHDWEEPRTVESPVGRAAHGVSGRLASARWRAELKALGNAVVPHVVEVIGRAILAVEEGHG